MSVKLSRLIFTKQSALGLPNRRLSSFRVNPSYNKNGAVKWYCLLTGTGLGIGYYAFKSFKNQSKIFALQPRRVRSAKYIDLAMATDCECLFTG